MERLTIMLDGLAIPISRRDSQAIFDKLCAYEDAEEQGLLVRLPCWIPVTERLPESVCKSYLCLTDAGYHCEVRWTNNVYGLGKSDNKWGWSIVDVPQYCKITHWMPLPEPPKEG